MLNSMQLYEKIEKIRVQKGIPVAKLNKAAGISHSTLVRYLLGKLDKRCQKSKVWIVYALHWEYPLPNCCMTSIRTN